MRYKQASYRDTFGQADMILHSQCRDRGFSVEGLWETMVGRAGMVAYCPSHREGLQRHGAVYSISCPDICNEGLKCVYSCEPVSQGRAPMKWRKT